MSSKNAINNTIPGIAPALLQAYLQHAPREPELALGCLAVTGGGDIYWSATQRLAQQVRCILFDLDHVAKVITDRQVRILTGTVAPLPTIAEDAPIKADCNSVGGSYTVSGSQLTIELGPTTRVACPPGSLENEYLALLSDVNSYIMEGETLVLLIKYDTGSIFFTPAE